MRRRFIAGFAVLVLLLATHWLYWYGTRQRTGAPTAETGPGRIYVESELPFRLWLPYPHQNLAELEEALGDVERLLRSLAILTGRPMPKMPSFGAARVPPAHELALAVDESGDRFIMAARVYPVAGLLARWAGRLASNPLLAGGRAEIDGRPVEVSWSNGTWTVRSLGVEAPPTQVTAAEPHEQALTWLRLARPRGNVPAGEYALLRDGRELVLRGGDAATLASLAELRHRREPMPLLMAETFALDGRFAARLLGLLPGARSIGGLPGATSVSLGPRRWRLPGESILELVGDGPPKARIDGWRVVALEDESLARGAAMVELGRSLDGHPPLSVAIWLEIGEAEQLIGQVVEALEQVPVIGRREARRWRAASRVLEPLSRYHRFSAFVTHEPPALSARLEVFDGAAN